MSQKEFIQMGTTLLKQGMSGSDAYVIESGKIEITLKDSGGGEIFLAALGPGEIVGEIAALFGGSRTASATAQEDTVLKLIPAAELRRSMEISRQMYLYVMGVATERMNETQKRLRWHREKRLGEKTTD